MGRSPCCDEASGLKKGPWAVEEDEKLKEHIRENGHRSWRNLPKLAGLNRCGKSCRLRWTNYLRPDIKRGKFTEEEERQIIHLHSVKGNKWSEIARHLSGRTDNEIKNFWNTHLRKKLLRKGIDPITHQPRPDLALLANLPNLLSTLSANPFDHTTTALGLRPNATDLAKLKILQNLLQALIPLNNFTPSPILLPPSTIDPTLIQNLTDQSHLFVNQPPLPLDVDVGYINTLNDQFNDHMDQNMCCNTDPMMNNNNNNNNSCYNNTILSPTTMLPVGDHVDNYNCEDVHARERSSSTASVSGSSTSTEATYNPWISELLWGHFELKDIVVDQYN